ncbi:MAG: UDP-N-acetylglucosamine--N-acetylmuramyl-(pentapeptide) pyrophosphoryl-undecaprenol N-acetylglucosamine transferase [Candidatus Magasanikbacteria bacterium]|nr:UDP-N-acetylglucosamine--N-acetylmuramyl-(pentapeptide) pyrophosphoryl-undecaprenol N-acetylglucosamine transferase [Candidatus Magasanikbacteria bacterium]
MKIIFSGGGTLGPVTPLLAIKEVLEKKDKKIEFVWVGTKTGPEKELVKKYNIPFLAISSGKFRRYLSFWNFTDLFKICFGFLQSFKILWKEKPDLCISAGGFVSVPVHFIAWIMGVPTWIHQQDVKVGLSNKIMSFFAIKITTALEEGVVNFSAKKVEWLGNPVREEILIGNKEKVFQGFGLKSDLPVVFVMGGGTGSLKINRLVIESLPHLKGICQIIHLTGKNKSEDNEKFKEFENYFQFDFFTEEMKDAYAISELVVARGGFGTLTEVAALKKAVIIIPNEGHQEDNVKFLSSSGALLSFNNNLISGVELAKVIKDLLQNKNKMKEMGERLNSLLPIAKEKDIISIIDELFGR